MLRYEQFRIGLVETVAWCLRAERAQAPDARDAAEAPGLRCVSHYGPWYGTVAPEPSLRTLFLLPNLLAGGRRAVVESLMENRWRALDWPVRGFIPSPPDPLWRAPFVLRLNPQPGRRCSSCGLPGVFRR